MSKLLAISIMPLYTSRVSLFLVFYVGEALDAGKLQLEIQPEGGLKSPAFLQDGLDLVDNPSCKGSHDPRLPDVQSDDLKSLAAAWFGTAKKVTKEKLEAVLSREKTKCSKVQVIDNHVYIEEHLEFPAEKFFYKGRLADVATLLKLAAQRHNMQDVEMPVCVSDEGYFAVAGGGSEAIPILSPWSDAAAPLGIPVPMLARHESTFWDFTDSKAHFLVQGASASWQKKSSKALFRGSVRQTECDAESDACGGETGTRSHCFRIDLLKDLAGKDGVDAGTEHMDEKHFEDFKYLLVIGNSEGWADRTIPTLFKSSAMFYVDQGAYEWYMPLLKDKVHYLRLKPTPESVLEAVKWANDHDSEVKTMVVEANSFAEKWFNPSQVADYMKEVADAYANLLDYKPTKSSSMKEFK